MSRLEPPDTMHLEAAKGGLELGNHREANQELEKIAPLPRFQNHDGREHTD